MPSYCLKCRKNSESKTPKVVRTKNRRRILLPKCAVCDSKKSQLIKEQKARGLLTSLGTRIPFSQICLLGPPLFVWFSFSPFKNKKN